MQSRVFIIYSTLQRIDVEYSFDFLPSHTKLPQKSDGENGGAGVCHCHGRRRRAAKQRAYTSTPPNVHIWACRRFRSTKYTRDRKYSHCVAYIIKTLSIYIYAHRCKCMRTRISQFIIVRSGSALLSCWADSLVRRISQSHDSRGLSRELIIKCTPHHTHTLSRFKLNLNWRRTAHTRAATSDRRVNDIKPGWGVEKNI